MQRPPRPVLACLLTLVAQPSLAAAEGEVFAYHKIGPLSGDLDGPLTTNDQFGHAVTSIGDVNGDGVPDLLTGRPNPANNGIDLLYMHPSGSVLNHEHYSVDSTVYGIMPYSLASMGDLDGDSGAEVLVGGTFGVDLLHLTPAGKLLGITLLATPTGSQYGWSVDRLDDFDGNGVDDFVAGAPGYDAGGSNSGAVFIGLLDHDLSVMSFFELSNDSGNLPNALLSSDNFGSSVASLGDLDADGVPDIAVGADQDDLSGSNVGVVYVLLMNADGTVKSSERLDASSGGVLSSALDQHDWFGTGLANVGDRNGDGVVDLMVGAHGDDDGSQNNGAVYLVFLNKDGTARSYLKYSETQGTPGLGLQLGVRFGDGIASLGDLNGDGYDEIAVGTPGEDEVANNTGSLRILFMEDSTTSVAKLIGCGFNASGSLKLFGDPTLGAEMKFSIDNPFASQTPGSFAFVGLSPFSSGAGCGIPVPGANMSPSSSNGYFLLGFPLPLILSGPAWEPNQPSSVVFEIPHLPVLLGESWYVQGVILDPSGSAPEIGLSQAYRLTFGT